MALSDLSKAEKSSHVQVLAEDGFGSAHNNMCAVSWAAILAGAAAAAALSLILLLLGTGLGLSSVSPWAHKGVTASAFGLSTIVWLAVTQILAAGMGGYLAGRLRIRWAGVQSDEVYFRDTAHGFLAWAVTTLITAVMLTSAIGAIVSGGTQVAATLTTATTTSALGSNVAAASKNDNETDDMGYFIDSLFRKNTNLASSERKLPATNNATPSTEVTRILIHAMRTNALPVNDLSHISQLVSRHTGLTQAQAEERVNNTYVSMQTKMRNAETATKDAAEKVRKASVYTTLWLFISLLMGAFSASLAATWGGRCRDA